MSIEQEPPIETRWDTLQQEAESLYQTLEGMFADYTSGSAQHILRNLATGLAIRTMKPRTPEETTLFSEHLERSIAFGKKYLSLLETFPQFKEGEMREGQGAFADLSREMAPRELIDAYERRLRGGE